MLYPVLELAFRSDSVSVKIVPSQVWEGNEQRAATIAGFKLACSVVPDRSASLVYCDDPDPGLTCVQAREQTGYDLWIEWDGEPVPQVFLGDAKTPVTLKHSGSTGYVSLNWGNFVGASSLRVERAARPVCRLPVEVRSRKMSYLDDYRRMLNDISERLSALIFDYGSPTAVYAQRAALDEHVAYLDYLFLRYLMDERRLPLYFRLVAADPHLVTRRERVWVDVSRACRLTPHSLHALFVYGEHLARPRRTVAPALEAQLDGHVPRQLLDEQVITTFDTPPNRFVKHFLAQLVLKLRELQVRFRAHRHGRQLAQDCRRWRREVEQLSRAHFLEEVGAMHVYPASSQVLLKREGYRQLNDYYRRFLLTGKVVWEGFEELLKTPNKDLATLYEYWCFFQLLDAVSAALGVSIDPRQFIQERDDVFRVVIDQGGKSWGQIGRATVYYNRYFRRAPGRSYSVTLHPDYTVELPGGRRLVFDAKYKYDRPSQFMHMDVDEDEEQAEELRLTYKRGDLYKMHTYRDALGAQAVFVLYPGNEFQAFSRDGTLLRGPMALTRNFQGVGAVDLRAGNTDNFKMTVARLLVEA
jgi:uncharacterized protein